MATFFGKMDEKTGANQRVNGVPGITGSDNLTEEETLETLLQPSAFKVIGEKEIQEAAETLNEYKRGKANLEERIVQDELWWEMRHWESIKGRQRGGKNRQGPQPTSAWLFNAIINKHADAMDNYPEPVVLPRERSDEESAKVLSQVLPVVMEYNDFKKTYSSNWWEKLKHGTALYGVFWDTDKENGLGDIDIRQIDLLNVFWEPGITDLQKSRNLFIIDLVDTDILESQYPEHKGKLSGNIVDVKEYIYDDTVDNSNKSVVVDWYYKKKIPGGKTVLHYAKFVNNVLLYASENEADYQATGFYEHGDYPIVVDSLFPEKGTPIGFGYVSICRDPQLYIDKLSANILESAMMGTKKRYFVSSSTNINQEQFLDWNNPLVEVDGEINDTRIKEVITSPISSVYVEVMNMKIEELKETAANRDVNSGGTAAGLTAASAIAALQEAGNKVSRDMLNTSYDSYSDISKLCIELMRQFYDETRSFRIISPNKPGEYEFVDASNEKIREQEVGRDFNGIPLYRLPIFDLKIKAQKTNPFSRMEQNERAKELYQLGFFNPERATEALSALDMMDFEGIDKIREQVSQGQTLLNVCQGLKQENDMLKLALTGMATGQIPEGNANPQQEGKTPGGKQSTANKQAIKPEDSLTRNMMQSNAPMTSYGQRLAKRSTPSLEGDNK